LLATATGLVKVDFSSRHTPEIEKRLAEFNASEIQTMHHNQDDINFFIETQVARAAEDLSHLYKRGGIFQTYAVLEKLKQKAQGMFRWVQLSLEYLHTSVSFREMSKRIHNLDQLQDLFDLCDEVYRNMMETRDTQDQLATRAALTFLAHGEDSRLLTSLAVFFRDVMSNSEDGDVRSFHHILEAIWFNSKDQQDRCDYTRGDLGAIKERLSAARSLFTHPCDAAFTSTQHERG
jgi:hypothetical protein